jgi:hypothetical protein
MESGGIATGVRAFAESLQAHGPIQHFFDGGSGYLKVARILTGSAVDAIVIVVATFFFALTWGLMLVLQRL